jgi:hypothetical protein
MKTEEQIAARIEELRGRLKPQKVNAPGLEWVLKDGTDPTTQV